MDPTPEEIKEAFRLFFLVKGHMDITQEMALASAPGYFKRLCMMAQTVHHYTCMMNSLK
jgi:hypothetical protein